MKKIFQNTVTLAIFFFQYQIMVSQSELQYLSSTTGAASYTLDYHDGFLLSGEGNTFSIYDVSNNTTPPFEKTFEHRFLSFIDDFTISGDNLYVAANTAGIFKYDLNTLPQPHLVTSFQPEDLSEAAYDIPVKGDTLFVAYKTKLAVFRDSGNEIVHLTDLFSVNNAALSRIRGCDVKGDLLAFTVGTNFIFPSQQDGIYIYDANTFDLLAFHAEQFCDPEDVIFGKSTDFLHVLGGGQFTSSIAPLTNPRGHYYVLNIADPEQPNLIFSDTIPGVSVLGDSQVIDGDNQNDTIYLATRTGSDFVNPLHGNVFVYKAIDENIQLLDSVNAGLLHFDVKMQNKTMHIASEWFGIRSVDVSDLHNSVNLGDTPTGGWAKSADIFGNRMVLANEGYGIKLFDISNPEAPVLIKTHLNIDNGFNFNVNFSADGQYIFGAYIEGFDEFRVFDANTLEEVASLEFFTGFEHTFVFENSYIAYATPIFGAKYLSVTDVSDPLNPVVQMTRPMTINDQLIDDDGKLFICQNDSLLVLDATNGFTDAFGLKNDSNNAFETIAKYKDTVFVYRNNLGLVRYQWDNDLNILTEDMTISLPNGNPNQLSADSFGLYIGYTEFGLHAYDKASLTELDYYRTGLDFIFPEYWRLEEMKTKNGLIALVEYFGQITLLTMNDDYVSGVDFPKNQIYTMAFPNPTTAKGSMTIEFPEHLKNEKLFLKIYNSDGKQIDFKHKKVVNRFHIDCSNFKHGLYFYSITKNSDLIAQGKFIIH